MCCVRKERAVDFLADLIVSNNKFTTLEKHPFQAWRSSWVGGSGGCLEEHHPGQW